MTKNIQNRIDISRLVDHFYAKIREDELLGPIFNNHISDEKWPRHLIKLTDFWETNLFGVAKFRGNPSAKHINVDVNLNYTIEEKHFAKWLNLWFETIDELYEGDVAKVAKDTARKMAIKQFLTIRKHRPKSETTNEND